MNTSLCAQFHTLFWSHSQYHISQARGSPLAKHVTLYLFIIHAQLLWDVRSDFKKKEGGFN